LENYTSIHNVMFVIHYNEKTANIYHLLQEQKFLYSSYVYYNDNNITDILDNELLCEINETNSSFAVFIPDLHCSEETKILVGNYAANAINHPSYKTIPFDFNYHLNKIDSIISSYAALRRENISLEQLENLFAQHQHSLDDLNREISLYPDKPFDPLNYSQEEQDDYSRYTQLVDALKHIDTHSSGGGIKAIINVAARKNIEDEILALEDTTIVKDAISYEKRTELQANIDSLIKQQENVKNQIATAQKNIARLNSAVASKTLEEAQQESSKYSEDIRRISEKQNFLKLPQTIATLKAEILLLQTTINDLQTKQVEIANLS